MAQAPTKTPAPPNVDKSNLVKTVLEKIADAPGNQDLLHALRSGSKEQWDNWYSNNNAKYNLRYDIFADYQQAQRLPTNSIEEEKAEESKPRKKSSNRQRAPYSPRPPTKDLREMESQNPEHQKYLKEIDDKALEELEKKSSRLASERGAQALGPMGRVGETREEFDTKLKKVREDAYREEALAFARAKPVQAQRLSSRNTYLTEAIKKMK